PREFTVPFDAWWFRLPRRPDESDDRLVPRAGGRRFVVVLPRRGYFQIAYLAPKGEDLRARGIETFRADIAGVCPEFADRVDALESMDDVRFLDCRLNRLGRWHAPGLL